MNFELSTTELPTENELQILFSQTSWASKSKAQDIKALLEQLVGVEEIFLNTKPELERFYNNFGFHQTHSITMKN